MLNRSFLFATLLAIASAASATPIFTDNFDLDKTALNQTDFLSGWTVTGDGTVDLIGAVGFYDLMPGNGRYVDLDGSSGKAGIFGMTWQLLAGVKYEASFELAGNHRQGGDDLVSVQFGTQDSNFVVAQNDDFTRMTLLFTPQSSGKYTLSFLNNGNDNVGALLDNVSLEIIPPPLRLAALREIPEPPIGSLFLAGLVGLGLVKRRRSA